MGVASLNHPNIAEADVLDYDVTPDEHIVAIWPDSRGWNRLHIVLNWFQELKRLVPTVP